MGLHVLRRKHRHLLLLTYRTGHGPPTVPTALLAPIKKRPDAGGNKHRDRRLKRMNRRKVRGVHKRAFVAGIFLFAALLGTPTSATARDFACPFNEFTSVNQCEIPMFSHTHKTVTVTPRNCGVLRHFSAYDRSKRVSLYAEAHWVAPGVRRIRAKGSPLGPLWVSVRTLSARSVRLHNRSRFPVVVSFNVTCQYGD